MSGAARGRDWQPEEVIDGRYRVIRLAGEGGMGRVYQVWHLEWGIDLAAKQLRPDMLHVPGAVEDFEREAEAWVSLGLHPNLCCCHYVRQIEGLPTAFAEYVPGGSLHDWIKNGTGQLYEGTPADVLRRILDVAIQFAWGLDHAHQRGMVHQDVKPKNVLLDTSDGDISVKVTDFGLARVRQGTSPASPGYGADVSVRVPASGVMTPAYASPEQLAGEAMSRRTDVYSYALSVFQMFTGKPLWHWQDDERLWQRGREAWRALSVYLKRGAAEPGMPPMPEALGKILLRCLHEWPEAREDPENPGSSLMAGIAEKIAVIYQEEVHSAYPRTMPRAADLLADELNNRALSLLDLGRIAEAEETFAAAHKVDPRHLAATYNAGLLRWRRSLITDEDLLAQIQAVHEPAGDSFLAQCLCANVHLERGDTESARTILNGIDQDEFDQPEVQAVQRALAAGHCGDISINRTTLGPGHPAGQRDDPWRSARISRNGTHMVTGHKRGVIRLWDMRTGEPLRTCTTESGDDEVNHVDVSADGRVGVGSVGTKLQVWDFATGNLVHEFFVDRPDDRAEGKDLGVNQVRLSPSGHWAFASTGGISTAGPILGAKILGWDLQTGKPSLWQRLDGWLASARFEVGADGSHLIVASANRGESPSGDGRRQLVYLTLRERRVLAELVAEWPDAMAFTADGRRAVFANPDRRIRVWDLHSGQCIQEIPSTEMIRTLAVSDDARWALSGGYEKARLWDLAAGRCLRTFEKDGSAIAVWLSPDARTGRSVSSVAGESRFVSWSFRHPSGYHAPPQLSRPRHVLELSRLNGEAGGLIREAERAIASQRYTAAHLALTQARAVPGHERDPEALRVWRELGRHLPRVGLRATWTTSLFKAERSDTYLRTASIAADGSVAVTGYDAFVYLWDIKSGDLLRTFPAMFPAALGVSADGQQVTVARSGPNTAQVDVWSARTGTHLFAHELAKGDTGSRVALMTPDGKRLLWGKRNEIQVLEVDTGRHLRSLPGHPPEDTIAWISANGRTAVSATKNSIRLWDLDNGECLLKIAGPANPFWRILAVCASPDGKHVVASGFSSNLDLNMRMWDLAGETVQDFRRIRRTVYAIQFSPDGRFIFLREGDAVTVRDVETGAPVHTLSGSQGHAEDIRLTSDGRYALVWENLGKLAQVWELDWELSPTPNR